MTEKQAKKEYNRYLNTRPEDPLPFGLWCLQTAKYKDLKPHADRLIAKNRAFIKADNEYVLTPTGRQKINPEYLENARIAREYKERMKTYTGTNEIGSDSLFALKQRADKTGESSNELIKEQTDLITGAHRDPMECPLEPEQIQPKKLHWWNRIFGKKAHEQEERMSIAEIMEAKKMKTLEEIIKIIDTAKVLDIKKIEVDGVTYHFDKLTPPVTNQIVPDLPADEIVKPMSALDELSEDEIKYWSTPYYDEIMANKAARAEALKEEIKDGN